MNIPSKIKPVIYGIIVFLIFTSLVVILKLLTHRGSDDANYFGILSNNDLLMGLLVAAILTLSHERKKRLRK